MFFRFISVLEPTIFTKGQKDSLFLSPGEIVNFNNDITSIRSTFEYPGKFICTVAGLYSFHLFSVAETRFILIHEFITNYSLAMQDSGVLLDIYKNDLLLVSLVGNIPGQFVDAGNSVVVHLNKGDHIYVKAHETYEGQLFGARDRIYTSFSGVLLAQNSRGKFVFHHHNVECKGSKKCYPHPRTALTLKLT